ncbi:hypothetical protein HDK77DRAFT_485215 [Phyllosticta capitalensis]|uniref:Uncharacterized protein n=1 Tax=Phyllosticta capitalensis TaxID=121624 RepID=A0ABR1YBA9_9PEZI
MPAHYAASASAQDEKATCAPQLKAQACRPSTYVDEVTRRRHPDVAALMPREEAKAGKDEGDRDTAPEVKDAAKKTKESSRRVRKHVHFAEDEGYASATGTPAPSPKVCSSPSPACAAADAEATPQQQLQLDEMREIKVVQQSQVCGERGDDRGRVLGKSGPARVPKPVHKDESSHKPQTQPSRTVTSRKATSQRTSKTKKKPRTEKAETVQNTGGSYRNQYGNIVFEDFC